MSDDILTRDRQNREADSSEQYAINAMGDRALQSAGYVVKRSRRALEKAMDKSHTAPARRFRGRYLQAGISACYCPAKH